MTRPVKFRLAAGSLLMCASGAFTTAWADPLTQMRQCRLLVDVALKAACYDAIALPPVGTSISVAAPAAIAASSAAAARSVQVLTDTAATAAVTYGLPVSAPALAPSGGVVAGALESSIAGLFEGWQGQSRIRLANGQVWQVTDGTDGVYTRRDPKVRITRGTLGSFFMQIEGISQTPRVRRVQ